jgi:hypothetical protein
MTAKPTDTKLIFAEALERSPEERKAYLDRVCGTDAELRQQVEILLNAYAQAGEGFLEITPVDADITLDADLRKSNAEGRTLKTQTAGESRATKQITH